MEAIYMNLSRHQHLPLPFLVEAKGFLSLVTLKKSYIWPRGVVIYGRATYVD
jgi:hypothetical protein